MIPCAPPRGAAKSAGTPKPRARREARRRVRFPRRRASPWRRFARIAHRDPPRTRTPTHARHRRGRCVRRDEPWSRRTRRARSRRRRWARVAPDARDAAPEYSLARFRNPSSSYRRTAAAFPNHVFPNRSTTSRARVARASRSRRVLRDARDVELLAERAAQRRQPAVPRQRVRLKRLVRESERVPRRDVVFINQILRERAFVVHDVGVDVVRAQQRRDAERFAAARRPVKRRGAVVVTEVRPSAAREQVRDATRRAAIRGDVERPDPHRALHLHVRACVLAEKTHDVEPARVAELDGGVKRRATVEIQRVDVEKIFDVLFRIRRRRMTRRKRRRLAAKPLEGVFRDTHVTGRARLDQGHAV